MTDGNDRIGTFALAHPVRYIDGRFCRAIEIIQVCIEAGEETFLQFKRERFATTDYPYQAGTTLKPWLLEECLQHRGDEVYSCDLFLLDERDEVSRVLMALRTRYHETGT